MSRKKIILASFLGIILCSIYQVIAQDMVNSKGLPAVLPLSRPDVLENKLKLEASLFFGLHQLPANPRDWETYRSELKNRIIAETHVRFDHDLPLEIKETGTIRMDGYKIKKITFQTRPGVHATANLFVPDGLGPFPAVVFMLGHWEKGKIDTTGPQGVGHALAVNGYVCLTIDPWGSGERTTVHGEFEDHGDSNNLGSSILNLGETLMGLELSDNIRAVDLLTSLPYVSRDKIGATGASGGGNQTMWLTAMDERIKASVPVVSVGTFGSYILGTPCICEVIINALTFTEEAGIIALAAPRAIKMINHMKDSNQAFFPDQMKRTYYNAKPVFKMLGAENNISFQLFDLVHGYMKEDREAMIGWFDLHLKGTGDGSPKKEKPFIQLPEDKLMVFATGQRDANVTSIAEYCKSRGGELRRGYLNTPSFNLNEKKQQLQELLSIKEKSGIQEIHQYTTIDNWDRYVLETADNKLIPVLIRRPADNVGSWVIICNPEGKSMISTGIIEGYLGSGSGIAIADLTGTGEASLLSTRGDYASGKLRILYKSEFWLGRSVMGEWVKELGTVADFLKSSLNARKISIDGSKEAGLAGLFYSVLENSSDIVLRDAPVTLLFDDRENVDFYSSAVFIPGFLKWGDVSLAAALTGRSVRFINPLTISGKKTEGDMLKKVQAEYDRIRKTCKMPGSTFFN